MRPAIRSPLLLIAGLSLCAVAAPVAAQVSITNHSSSFRPGPYAAMSVDPADQTRVAVATEDGHVTWTNNGGTRGASALVIPPRRYDSFAMRSGNRAGLSLRTPKGQRATRLFLYQLREGLPTPRFSHWMAINDPVTVAYDVAMPAASGRMALAGPSGIWVSDRGRATWIRVLGGPGPMPREGDMNGLAVAFNPANPDHLIAATDQGVWVSKNGGHTFMRHPDKGFAEEFVTRMVWGADRPSLVFAAAGQVIYLSEDSGATFQPAFSADGEIRDLSMSDDGVYVATAKGLHVVSPDGTKVLLKDKDVIGAIQWESGAIVAATKETLYYILDGIPQAVMQTTPTDPYLKLQGGPRLAWLLSKSNVIRIGPPIARKKPKGYRPPRMLMTMGQVERAVNKNYKLPKPHETFLYDRWYAKILPRLNFEMHGTLEDEGRNTLDATFPVGFRFANGRSQYEDGWSIWASWDLSKFVLGDDNASNPYTFIESSLREGVKELRIKIRGAYRECAQVAKALETVPEDPELELQMRMRLEELASYLSFMSGKEVVSYDWK